MKAVAGFAVLASAGLVSTGTFLLSVPVGLIATGVVLFGLAVLFAAGSKEAEQ